MLDTAHGCALSAHEQPTKGMLRAMSELGPESSGQSMQAKVRGGYLAGACVPGPVPPTFTQKRPACDCGGSGALQVVGPVVIGTRTCAKTGRERSAADVLLGDVRRVRACLFVCAAVCAISWS